MLNEKDSFKDNLFCALQLCKVAYICVFMVDWYLDIMFVLCQSSSKKLEEEDINVKLIGVLLLKYKV